MPPATWWATARGARVGPRRRRLDAKTRTLENPPPSGPGRRRTGAPGMDRSSPSGDRLTEILDSLRGRVSRQQFETWFRKVRLVEATPEQVVFGVENAFFRDWIQTYYLEVLRSAASDVLGGRPEVSVAVATADAPAAPAASGPRASAAV